MECLDEIDATSFGYESSSTAQGNEQSARSFKPPERGIGIDLIEIARIGKSIGNPRFLTRFFGERELAEYRARGGKTSYIAANFCAKEAFSKAIGTGIRDFSLNEVELLRDGLGKPYLVFSGRAAVIVDSMGLAFETSVSHTREYAVAVVQAYAKPEKP